MPTFNIAGIDIGFRKTGITIFRMTPDQNDLIAAATVCPKEPGKSVVNKDVHACWAMLDGVKEYLQKYDVKALFLEFPSGGSQSGRAARCMGMATALSAALIRHFDWELGYEIYTPSQIETLLGIKAAPGSKKKMTKGHKRAEKKDALKRIVLEKYPDDMFHGWPKTKALAEDAYDSAAVFLAAQLCYGEGLYYRLRAICEGTSKQEVDGGSESGRPRLPDGTCESGSDDKGAEAVDPADFPL